MNKKLVTKLSVFNCDFKVKLNEMLRRQSNFDNNLNRKVSKILDQIKNSGDSCLINLLRRHDSIKVDRIEETYISPKRLKLAFEKLEKEQKDALMFAAKRIKSFHEKQIPENFSYKDEYKVGLGLKFIPIQSAGFYVPGGKAIYPSSVLMTAIPAYVAGVKRRVVVSPITDQNNSSIVLAAAHVAKATEFICMGGAHAIGALAFGTETIKSVDKIVGPGNAYVAEAKRQVFGKVGIDSIAGPSEVVVVCDNTADPKSVAIDLLSQAEHDQNSQPIMITDSEELANKVEKIVEYFLKNLARSEIASASWYNKGGIIIVRDINEAIDIVNTIAPEHLELIVKKAETYINKIKNAGSIFIGPYTPEAIGDYIAGPNHVLPTNGTARFSSGLSVLDFYKRTTIVNCNKKNLSIIGKHAVTLAQTEGLEAHAKSILLRIK